MGARLALTLAFVSDVGAELPATYFDEAMRTQADPVAVAGLLLPPSSSDVLSLEREAKEAEKARNETKQAVKKWVPVHCLECIKSLDASGISAKLKEAERAELKARRRVEAAKALQRQELKRIEALPYLISEKQRQANLEYRKRLQLEQRAEEVHNARVAAETAEARNIELVRQEITRKRLADRLRAAEDARLVQVALRAAHQAKEQKRAEEHAKASMQRAKRAAKIASEKAVSKATAEIANATASIIREVADASAAAAAKETRASIQRSLGVHIDPAVEQDARRKAAVDKARAYTAKVVAAALARQSNVSRAIARRSAGLSEKAESRAEAQHLITDELAEASLDTERALAGTSASLVAELRGRVLGALSGARAPR